jgi:hypothetical protein
MKNKLLFGTVAVAVLTLANQAVAAESGAKTTDTQKSEFIDALENGKLLLDARYRFEFVNQAGLENNADAHTLHTRIGYETGKFKDFSVLVEGENILDLAGVDYNDTINGKTTYPTVADPEDTALNRLQLNYSGIADTNVILGRQNITLDNQRYLGGIAWRQNDQTFDAISITNKSLSNTTLFYAYADQVNRILGTDSPQGKWDNSDIHLFNANYAGLSIGKIIGYSYLLDIPDSLTSSSATYGARFEGKQTLAEGLNGLLNLEYAKQADYADNPNNFDFDYYVIEPALNFGSWTTKFHYSSIEGNGTAAMQFALGTNHAHNGWVDKFLITPVNGLVDKNASVAYQFASANQLLNGTKLTLVYHDFDAERGNADYGNEWNFAAEQTFEKIYTAGVKAGHYQANDLFTDTTKIMPYLQVKF